MTLDAGEANALTVAFSPDREQLVAGYSSGRARVWDVSTRLQLTLLAGSASGVTTARFNADGSEVVTTSLDGTIRVWHSQPRELQTESATSYAGGAPNPAFWAAYISNSQILTLDYSGHLYAFAASGEQQAVINPGTAVNSAAWNRAGTEIVTADLDGMVNLWHAIGPKFTQIPLPSPIHLNGPGRVGMSPDGSRIAIVTPDHYTITGAKHTYWPAAADAQRGYRDHGGCVQPERAPDSHRWCQRPGGGVGRCHRTPDPDAGQAWSVHQRR